MKDGEDDGQIDSSSKKPSAQIKKTACVDEFGGDPEYDKALKLKIIPHGNCDYCEVSI